ncbi:hypothetical protein ACFYTQ_18110 [Nocardia sp. NPDC004068]|uniref:hypothetical protein n=1 Tax=Nocardia sp. NPDC004068 TaxID=3364303 RepID=UPI0036BD6F83
MGGLWSELAKKLAEKWLTMLVLPGAFYLAVAAAALTLGHAHALDVGLLVRRITAYAKDPAVGTTGGQVALLAGILAGAAAVGLCAQAVGTLVEHLALAADWTTWPRLAYRPVRWAVARRRRRWEAAGAAYDEELRKALAPDPADRPDPVLRHRAARTRARVAVERPERPTWSGDRVHAAAVRLDRDLHLDLATVWPPLWLLLPDAVRTQITDARTASTRAATLAAWSILYVPLTIWWWPAAPLALVIALTARHRIRAATDTYATLLESATWLHIGSLATQLGIEHEGVVTPRLGHAVTRLLTSAES